MLTAPLTKYSAFMPFKLSCFARFDVFIDKDVHVIVVWEVTSCSYVVEYHRFGGPCLLHLHREDEGIVSCHNTVGHNLNTGVDLPLVSYFAERT
jgi:hypothetical protein